MGVAWPKYPPPRPHLVEYRMQDGTWGRRGFADPKSAKSFAKLCRKQGFPGRRMVWDQGWGVARTW